MLIDEPKILLSAEQIAKASKSELTNLVNQILNELERRKNEQNVSNYQVSSEQLEEQAHKMERALNNFSTSPNNSSQPSNGILPTFGIIGVASLLVGGLMI